MRACERSELGDGVRRPRCDANDPVWPRLVREANDAAQREPALAGFLETAVSSHCTLEQALGRYLAGKLASPHLTADVVEEIFREALTDSSAIGDAVRQDLCAVPERDPAARTLLTPFLFFKGFQSLQCYRMAHWLWSQGRTTTALFLQSRISEVFAVDIHPAARIGKGILMDHGTGVVIGETAVVGDGVSMLHEVTLGGTGKEAGDRHPKVESNVLIGAGAKILGNIRIGEGSKVAACSVVLSSVPPFSTVAGIPARIVGRPKVSDPARVMDQTIEFDYCI
ncbi:MAG: serine O-acetyltransferase [Kiritimatiellia bacterium]